MLISGLEHVTC